ncbi:MAG: homoserine kinase, partial [Ilumatobacteraceae bacterium]
MTAVSAPASSANLGPGFDVLGLALDRRTTVGSGPAPEGAQALDEHHPAVIAHRRAGGAGDLWGFGGIPMGRGLGFSGAVRVAGAMLAHVERDGAAAASDAATRASVLDLTADLEGHPDNVAPSVYGGLVIADGDLVVPVAVDPSLAVVAWVPDAESTSTDRSRAMLPSTVDRADAVFNMARVATLVS